MTATRIGGAGARIATIAAAVSLWVVAATVLWRTRVPADLELPQIDPRAYFTAAELERTARYARFLRVDWGLAALVQLAVLAFLARRGGPLARVLRGGRIARGVAIAAFALVALWLVRLPFGVAAHWWRRRYGVARQDYLEWLLDPWARLVAELLLACAAVALVMVLAQRLGPRWWLAGGPLFAVLGGAFVLLQPAILEPRLEPLGDRRLAREIRSLARRAGIENVRVKAKEARSRTRAVNAEVLGVGPTRTVVLWDTLLGGRVSRGEIRVLVAHELAHVQREHVWKGLAWFALFAVPGAFVVARVTERKGGLADPAVVPLALLVLAALQLAASPAANLISRRYEAEADWLALQLTREPDAAVRLFRRFPEASLTQPRPPTWAYVLRATHPSIVERIAMAEAWKARALTNR